MTDSLYNSRQCSQPLRTKVGFIIIILIILIINNYNNASDFRVVHKVTQDSNKKLLSMLSSSKLALRAVKTIYFYTNHSDIIATTKNRQILRILLIHHIGVQQTLFVILMAMLFCS